VTQFLTVYLAFFFFRALQWVQKYIQYFGGDPNQVTVFGQSAGAMSCSMLLGNPTVQSENLFQSVIMESDPFSLILRTPTQQEAFAELFSILLGCPVNNSRCLLGKTMDQILDIQLLNLHVDYPPNLVRILSVLPWIPTIDGKVRPRPYSKSFTV